LPPLNNVKYLIAGWYHFITLFVVIVWGTTFVSTKVLLSHELSPGDIIFYRFLMAYTCIWFFGQRKLFADNLKDEFLFMLTGITGGSLYFIAENTALEITLASNVALLVCTAPILTTILSRLFHKSEKLKRYLWHGSLLALTGVAFISFNGRFILQINPLGDLLCLVAALSWAFYTILIKLLENRYHTLLITRKVFFYGVITLVPSFILKPLNTDVAILMQPIVWGNLLFLGLAASLLCYFLWNTAVKKLGAVRTTNYVYLIPLVTLLSSVIVIDETITWIAMAGALLILGGVALTER